ncbi:MAG: ferritin family protein [Deltaproteobacteria bacterium]|nr:ferritin family protein [Deltaproteobacteria bacterium]
MDAYKIALQTEDDGYNLYMTALERSTHPLGREILAFLAKEELKHTATIKKIVSKIQEGGAFDEKDFDLDATAGETIFTRSLDRPDSRLVGSADDLAVLKEGVRFETEGIAFFQKAADTTANPEEKKFYLAMVREERAHKELLESSIEYLENPESWFERQQPIILDGV